MNARTAEAQKEGTDDPRKRFTGGIKPKLRKTKQAKKRKEPGGARKRRAQTKECDNLAKQEVCSVFKTKNFEFRLFVFSNGHV